MITTNEKQKKGKCDKVAYKSLTEAERHVKARWHVKREWRAYFCRLCKFYHLTTSKLK
jgi:hypothetical protein